MKTSIENHINPLLRPLHLQLCIEEYKDFLENYAQFEKKIIQTNQENSFNRSLQLVTLNIKKQLYTQKLKQFKKELTIISN